MNPSKFSRGGG
jgi:hypothetical protein